MITLEKLRETKTGLSQKAIAEMLGVSPSSYCYYEKGKRIPSFDKMVALANLFGVDTQLIINIFLPKKLANSKKRST